jgi:3-deoxy-D-manno-octulosonic-acid transferase
MLNNELEKGAFWLYNLAWGLAMPVLRRNHRLAEGFDQRVLQHNVRPAHLWIQAASAGEAYLAWALVKNLRPAGPVTVLMTSNTSQGMKILNYAIEDIIPNDRGVTAYRAYFPFDKPAIMEAAVRHIRPKTMVLLESELWPGLLAALKKYNSKTLIINGRLTRKSLTRYLVWPSFWYRLRPDRILAVSENDAERFATLFGTEHVEVMGNMKFDRLGHAQLVPHGKNPLEKIVRPGTPLLVLGSVRREEEPAVERIILDIHRRQPETVIALFPRHMHRITYWKQALERLTIPWTLRSETKAHVPYGTVILWDIFGELALAYQLSNAAFVGGSLAPLGGQNFLEALTSGVVPVIGPFWENFAWVGREIVEEGLVRNAGNWKEAADILVEGMTKSPSHETVREAALRYMRDRQGGTTRACNLVAEYLKNTQESRGTVQDE